MVSQEAYALAELGKAIGRTDDAKMLTARGDHFRDLIRKHLWDAEMDIYANKFVNGTFSDRISPTSFYAMQTGAPTDAQALAMVQGWLTNSSRFCVSPSGNFDGNTHECYWGLPSIQATDPAFPLLGYWRGVRSPIRTLSLLHS